MEHRRPSSRNEFHVAFICALPLEYNAVLSVLDEEWDELEKSPGDLNSYVTGRIGHHNAVLALLQDGMGKVNAAVLARDLHHSYRHLRVTLLVGICGGVPKAKGDEIVLGDVIISSSLVEYDFGRQYPDGFRRKKGSSESSRRNREVLGLLDMLGTDRKESVCERTSSFLKELQQRKPKYAFPLAARDRLFQPGYRHKHRGSLDCECRYHVEESDPVCEKAMEEACVEMGCEDGFLVERARVQQRLAASDSDVNPHADDVAFNPAIHVGSVGSGDTVMKSAVRRDKIAEQEGIIAFEMEGAGLWEHPSCLVVKGVCDYADSHKNKEWQEYAAATAASAAKALLTLYTPAEKTDLADDIKPLRPKWAVPFPQDPDFVDQVEISTWLREKFQLQGARVALIGLGGIGKSQLAIQFAYAVRHKSHVFWVNATTRSTLEASYRDIAHKLGLEAPNDSLEDINQRVGDWLGDEQNGRWTVILDNFDDYSIVSDEDPRLSKLLPQASNGFTLITSRTLQAVEKLTGNPKNICPVPAMSEEVALKLFLGKLVQEKEKIKDGVEKEEAQEVVRLLDCMPLAVSQAAAYINRRSPRVSVKEYADMLRIHDRQSTLLSWEYDDDRRYHGASTSVLGTWTVTLEQIRQERPSAAHLLSLMSFFSHQSIPGWALKAWYESDPLYVPQFTVRDTIPSYASSLLSSIRPGRRYLNRIANMDQISRIWDRWASLDFGSVGKPLAKEKSTEQRKHRLPSLRRSSKMTNSSSRSTDDPAAAGEEYENDLDTLLGYSLVMPTASKDVFKMHPLVCYCTQTWLSRSQSIYMWKRRFLIVAVVILGAFKVRTRGWLWPGLDIHFNPIAEEFEPEDAPTARVWLIVAWNIFNVWNDRGCRDLMAALLPKMLAVAERWLGAVDVLTIGCMDLQAENFRVKGEYAKAEATYKDLLQRAASVDDQNGYQALESKMFYAEMLSDLGRLDEAEQLSRSVVVYRVRALGPRADDTLRSLGSHANVLSAMGRFEEACSIVKGLLQEDWTNREAFVQHITMQFVADVAMAMAKYNPAEEVEPLLRELADYVEGDPKRCCWFPYMVEGPFHYYLGECLEGQGKLDEAASSRTRGIELMAKIIPLPSLQPPTLVQSLLEDQEVGKERGQQLLQSVIENLHSQDAKSDDFYWGMINIARRLYMQGRGEEAVTLTHAIYNYLSSHGVYGKTHRVTNNTHTFRKYLEDWVREGHQKEGRGEMQQDKNQSISADSGADTLVG